MSACTTAHRSGCKRFSRVAPKARILLAQQRSKHWWMRCRGAHSPTKERPGSQGAACSEAYAALGYAVGTTATAVQSYPRRLEVYPHKEAQDLQVNARPLGDSLWPVAQGCERLRGNGDRWQWCGPLLRAVSSFTSARCDPVPMNGMRSFSRKVVLPVRRTPDKNKPDRRPSSSLTAPTQVPQEPSPRTLRPCFSTSTSGVRSAAASKSFSAALGRSSSHWRNLSYSACALDSAFS